MGPKQSPNLLLKKETKGGRKNLGFSRMKDLYHRTEPLWEKRAIVCPKPSLKIRTASAIFWIYLGIFRDNGWKNVFLEITILFFKIEILNFQKPHKISTRWNNCYFHSFIGFLWGFTKFCFKHMLKVSAFFLDKQKSFISKKIFFKLLSISEQK